jgi:formamidopyrimidine-DNA glycosylase
MELPEVEVLRRDLEKDVVGRRVGDVEVKRTKNTKRVIRRHKAPKEFRDRLKRRKIARAERKGKYILLQLDDGNVLVAHFGMSGRFMRGTKRTPPPQHTHVVIRFQQGGDLRFIDPRTFGELFAATPDDLGRVKELDHIAIDPLEHTFTWQQFGEMMARHQAKLKPLLMDQGFISGLGNIYSDEVLFAAGLRHDRASDELSSQEVRRLYRAMVETLQDAVKYRGSTLADMQYVDLFGKPGEYQLHHKVYAREGEACRRCRHPIARERYGGRSTFYCEACQV